MTGLLLVLTAAGGRGAEIRALLTKNEPAAALKLCGEYGTNDYECGRALLAAGETDSARTRLERAVTREPDSEEATAALTLLEMFTVPDDAVADAFTLVATGRYEEAVKTHAEGDGPWVRLLVGEALEGLARWRDAYEVYAALGEAGGLAGASGAFRAFRVAQEKLKDEEAARLALVTLVARYPHSPFAPIARRYLGE